MQGFTLIETVLILLIVGIIFGITFSFNALNKDFFYLKDFSKEFAFALNTVADMAQRVIEKNGLYYCGYGIYFENSTTFEVLGFATSTKLCDDVISTSTVINEFINSNLTNKTYILKNQDLVTSNLPGLSFNGNLREGYQILFSTSTKCESAPEYTPPLIFLYVYGNFDIFLINKPADQWKKQNFDSFYICFLKPGRESYIIKLNKLGQINIVQ